MKVIKFKIKIFLIMFLIPIIAFSQTNVSYSLLDDVLIDNDQKIEMLRKIASVYYQTKDYDYALKTYDKILKESPSDQEAQYMIGVIYITSKKYKEAIDHLEKQIDRYPNNYHGFNNLAWLYATADDKKFRDAEKSLDLSLKALALAPFDKHIWSTLAEAYFISGNFSKAKRAMQQVVDLATQEKGNLTQDMVKTYNSQIEKFDRALKTQELMNLN
tara:strand:- start:140 stop:787 length:648 start_codon:yes stop_codon:yes gene_type:complete